MKKIVCLILILVTVISQFAFSTEFKEIEDTEITFKWKIEGETLQIILSAPTEGWVAVGFNPSKVMKGADFKLAYVENGETVLEDHFGTGLFGHKIDTSLGGSSDFEIINGSEENGVTTVEFSMPLNSGDDYDKILIENEEVKILLAYGSRDDLTRKHKKRTSVIIRL